MPEFEELTVDLVDGYAAYARLWGVAKPIGAVLYHHGIQSHCGWYEGSARALATAGFCVLQVDRRGSGRNAAQRGHAESAERLVDDARAAGEMLVRRTGFETYHVVGVSWGGKLAVATHVVHPARTASLTLVTPGLFPKVGVSKTAMAQIGFAMLYEPSKLFDIPLNDAAMFTFQPEWQQFIGADELTLRQCTAGFYLASRRMDRTVAKVTESPMVPIHVFLAGEERIIDNEKTSEFFAKLSWPQIRVTAYDRARHSLEFDCPDDYFAATCAFLCEHTSALARTKT